MKKPFLRVTKWLGDIPVEAGCTHCPAAKFRASSSSHRPSGEEYRKQLQSAFDHHVKTAHAPEDSGQGG